MGLLNFFFSSEHKGVRAIISCCLGLAFLGVTLFFHFRNIELKRTGVLTSGTVSELVVSNPGRTTESFRPRVRFTANGGHYEVLTSTSSKYHVGQDVQVRYLPTNPSIAEIDGSDALLGTYLITGSVAAVFLFHAIVLSTLKFVKKNDVTDQVTIEEAESRYEKT